MIGAIYVRAIQPVLVGRLTLIPLTCNFGQLRQSVMLDKAFVIGNGIGGQEFYQTWSCRRARKMRVLGSRRWGEAQQALIPFLVIPTTRKLKPTQSALREAGWNCLVYRIIVAFHILST